VTFRYSFGAVPRGLVENIVLDREQFTEGRSGAELLQMSLPRGFSHSLAKVRAAGQFLNAGGEREGIVIRNSCTPASRAFRAPTKVPTAHMHCGAKCKWALLDSNQRPTDYESAALTD
jgi:hypothetical protein